MKFIEKLTYSVAIFLFIFAQHSLAQEIEDSSLIDISIIECDTTVIATATDLILLDEDFDIPDSIAKPKFTKNNSYIPLVPVDSMIAFGKGYLGLPYRTTRNAPWALDCSGYVSMLYAQYGIKLPHSSGAIAEVTKTISLKDAQPGDLIFFKGRDSRRSRVGHVALIIEVHDDHIIMMHSTNSKGIITEPYPSGHYYNKRFLKVGRL